MDSEDHSAARGNKQRYRNHPDYISSGMKLRNKGVSPMELCPEHKCIKDKLDAIRIDRNFWHRILDSKWFFWALTGIIAAFFLFNAWVTTRIFAQASQEKQIAVISENIKDIKEENKRRDEKREEEKKEQEMQRREDEAQRAREQRELMKILLDIQKQIRK
jgi:hypothetical protein